MLPSQCLSTDQLDDSETANVLRSARLLLDVHRLPDALPLVPLIVDSALPSEGDLTLGDTPSLRVRGRWPRLALFHEFGHYIDRIVLGVAGLNAGSDPARAAWRRAVASTDRIGWWLDVRTDAALRGVVLHEGITLYDYAGYVLRHNELWARSYTQFIVMKCGDEAAGEELARAAALTYPVQWDDDDFRRVYAEVEAFFTSKGWK